MAEYTGARNGREAILLAVRDFNRRRRLERLPGMLGIFERFMPQKDLEEMREDRKWEQTR